MTTIIGVAKQQALLCRQLDQVASVLKPLLTVDTGLHDRLQPLLQLEVIKLRDRVEEAALAADPWAQLREVHDDAAGLFTECLGFLGGAVGRHAGLDGGLCRIADHLVATLRTTGQLAGYAISVPAEREYVNTLSSLIRLRFPGEGLWDLPVIVHEMGHAVFQELGGDAARRAVTAAAAQEQAKPGRLLLSRYEELWADVFATYVAGPSYAATCLRLRFDPSLAGASDVLGTHPSVDTRAAAILATLTELEKRRQKAGAIAGSLVRTITELETGWLAELTAAHKTVPADDVSGLVCSVAASYWAVLDKHVPTLRCSGLAEAEGAGHRLEAGKARPPSADILDIMNAAWLARLTAERRDHTFDPLAQRALAWCAEVADG